jgi:response regulator RpfG family c-di-GMP phosphodiesterase
MNRRILMVDDDERILSSYHRSLRTAFDLDVALGGAQAMQAVEEHGPYAVVVADMHMPGMNGIQLLEQVQSHAPDTVRVMLTGNADQHTAVEAVNRGRIFRFLNKPCAVPDLSQALEASLEQYRLVTAERELLDKTLSGAVKVLSDLLAMVDPVSFVWTQQAMDYALTLGRMLGERDSWALALAVMLGPIGRVTVPRPVLEKMQSGQRLTPDEQAVLTRVPEIGSNLITRIPRLEGVAKLILYQAKSYDGKGFPHDEVEGERIPLGARILNAVYSFVELEQQRKSAVVAIEEMKLRRGRYDLKILAALEELVIPTAEPQPRRPVQVTAEHLLPDMVLVRPVHTADGVLLFAEGARLSASHIEKLQNFARLFGLQGPLTVYEP